MMMPPADAAVAPVAADRSGSSRSDCTDCSHCAKRSRLRTRAGVRVSVNLGQFFSDQRARAFMWAPYGRCVQWLGRRVARVFGLPDDIALMSRGHMLPVLEPLLMLDRDDPVEVVNMSYVVSTHDKQDEPNVTTQRVSNDTSASTSRLGINVRPIQSNVTIKQESFGQLPTSSQGESLTENQDVFRVSPTEDMEMTKEFLGGELVDKDEDLQKLKRRALRLLDQHCHMMYEASAPKRVRRRRRRRRLPDAAAEEPRPSDDAASPPGAVLRDSSSSRPPRLVRALSPSPSLQYAA